MGFVAFKGGMGTVTEISLVWNKLQTRVLASRPLILVGECWTPVVAAWKQSLVVSDSDVSLLDFADNAEQAFKVIMAKSGSVIL